MNDTLCTFVLLPLCLLLSRGSPPPAITCTVFQKGNIWRTTARLCCTAYHCTLQACLRELQAQLERLQKVPAGTTAAAEGAAAEQVPNPADLRDNLTGGLYHCLYWLFGLELPGLDTQEAWGGNFQVLGSSVCVQQEPSGCCMAEVALIAAVAACWHHNASLCPLDLFRCFPRCAYNWLASG